MNESRSPCVSRYCVHAKMTSPRGWWVRDVWFIFPQQHFPRTWPLEISPFEIWEIAWDACHAQREVFPFSWTKLHVSSPSGWYEADWTSDKCHTLRETPFLGCAFPYSLTQTFSPKVQCVTPFRACTVNTNIPPDYLSVILVNYFLVFRMR